jgi:hypothetical protein
MPAQALGRSVRSLILGGPMSFEYDPHCHICYRTRPIDELGHHRTRFTMGLTMHGTLTVRYCPDRPACVAGVRAVVDRWRNRHDVPEGDTDPEPWPAQP